MNNKDAAESSIDIPEFPNELRELIKAFNRNLSAYKKGAYKEAEVRQEFIDPFFEALGWDVGNKGGNSNNFKEVVLESNVKVRGKKKHPDYSFRIGGATQFYCEAKKPSVVIKTDPVPALQTRKYGWSAKHVIGALTDFEELAIYDMRLRPNKEDGVEVARLDYFGFLEYEENWGTIYKYLSKKAILQGEHERIAAKKAKGSRPVDEEFLKNIETWRELLAKDLIKENANLLPTADTLTETVQRLIDRIVFLRIAEDRGLESYGKLEKLTTKKNIYSELTKLFKSADERYNSGLFHFTNEAGRGTPDMLMKKLMVSNAALKEIILSLYPSKCLIEFSVVSADILGSVYERFLGKTITITASGTRAKVEEKPEVRKAGGVYYTPTYIVNSIVENTLAPLLEGKTAAEAKKLKIIDPACGSGSFLVAAYQYMLNWYFSEYEKDIDANLKKDTIEKISDEEDNQSYILTATARKEILQNNIFGVDIDATAVEVAKLSLLLKVLEGVKLPKELRLMQERALPDLGNNLRCGNSLVGNNYLNDQQGDMYNPTDDEVNRSDWDAKVNCFDWESHRTGFGAIMQSGGFNAVVGNPPYARVQSLTESQGEGVINYFKNNYAAATESFDIYVLFLEKGHKLLAEGGRLGFILPHKFLNASFGKGIRSYLTKTQAMHKMVHFGAHQIFKGAMTFSALVYLSKPANKKIAFTSITGEPQKTLNALPNKPAGFATFAVPHPSTTHEKWYFHPPKVAKLVAKLTALPTTMGDVAQKIFQGIVTGNDSVFVLKIIAEKPNTTIAFSKAMGQEVEIENGLLKKFLMGRDIFRYQPPQPNKVVLFPYYFENNKAILMETKFIKENFPLGWNYLWENRKELKKRERGKYNDGEFYRFGRPQNMAEYEKTKILMPEVANRCRLSYDGVGYCFTTKIYGVCLNKKNNPMYILGLLNSRMLWFFLSNSGDILNLSYTYSFKTNYIAPFPLPSLNLKEPAHKAMHSQLATSVENMLALEKHLAVATSQAAPNTQEITQLRRQIESLNNNIDGQVYKLYNLSPEEIDVVESTTGNVHKY